jgi:hypothetical protein
MGTNISDTNEWVKLVGDYGAMIVITAVVIMLVTWGAVFVVLRLFGKKGLVPWAFSRFLGDDGYVEQVVSEHNKFVSSVSQSNTDTKDMVKGALALSEVHLARDKRTHEMVIGCGEHFCDVLDHVGEKLEITDRIGDSVIAIRRELERAKPH